jgi:hypothetical protein
MAATVAEAIRLPAWHAACCQLQDPVNNGNNAPTNTLPRARLGPQPSSSLQVESATKLNFIMRLHTNDQHAY